MNRRWRVAVVALVALLRSLHRLVDKFAGLPDDYLATRFWYQSRLLGQYVRFRFLSQNCSQSLSRDSKSRVVQTLEKSQKPPLDRSLYCHPRVATPLSRHSTWWN
jgi:hypothetical protein